MKRPYRKRAGVRLTDDQRDLAARYFQYAHLIARKFLRDPDQVVEAAANGLLRSVREYDGRTPIATYIGVMVQYAACEVRRPPRAAKRTPGRPVLRIGPTADWWTEDAAEPADPIDRIRQIDDDDEDAAKLGRLDARDWLIINARLAGMPRAEIARRFGFPQLVVAIRLREIRRQLSGSA